MGGMMSGYRGLSVLILVLGLGLHGVAHASSYDCSYGELVLVDEDAGTCQALPEVDGILEWRVGEVLGVQGGECEGCPGPIWCPDVGVDGGASRGCDETPSCTIDPPWIEVSQAGEEITADWVYGADVACSSLSVLSTELELGEYLISVNGDQSWTVRYVAGGDDVGPVPTDTGASEGGGGASSGAGGGCASAPSDHAPVLALVVALLAAVHLRRRLSGYSRNE
jgi:uncharacterized protein (TIGR03382 family)